MCVEFHVPSPGPAVARWRRFGDMDEFTSERGERMNARVNSCIRALDIIRLELKKKIAFSRACRRGGRHQSGGSEGATFFLFLFYRKGYSST